MAALFLVLGHGLVQRMLADHTVTETATGTWHWVGTMDDPFMSYALILGGVEPRPDFQTLTAETLNYHSGAHVTYTLQLLELPPSGDGWVRQGEAPVPPQISVTRSAEVTVRINPMPGDVRPSVSISWNGLGYGTLTTTQDTTYAGTTVPLMVDGPSYTATGDLDGQIMLPSVYAGSASLYAMFRYDFAMAGVTSGSATYTRQVPGPHSSVPEPQEWAMLAGLPLAAFACTRRLRLRRMGW